MNNFADFFNGGFQKPLKLVQEGKSTHIEILQKKT